MIPLRHMICACGLSAMMACTQFPELDSALTAGAQDAPYPSLLPVEELNARVTAPRITEQTAPGIAARVAALRARAQRLRGTVIDSSTRARMSIGVEDI